VLNVDDEDASGIRTFPIAQDLLMASALPKSKYSNTGEGWQPIFSPKQFVKEHPRIK